MGEDGLRHEVEMRFRRVVEEQEGGQAGKLMSTCRLHAGDAP